MKIKDWITPFQKIKWLICDELTTDGSEYLEIKLVEHKVIDKPFVPKNSGPLEKVLEGSKPIEETSYSRKWKVIFNNAVAIKQSSESFYLGPFTMDRPTKNGNTFLIEPSLWVEEIEKDGILNLVLPGCKHFVIFTSHSTIEVVSKVEPIIES